MNLEQSVISVSKPRAKPFIWKCLYSHVNELTLALWIKLIFKWKDLQLETEEKGLLNIKWSACVLRAQHTVHKAEPMFYFVRSIYRKTSCVDHPGAFLTRNRKNAPPKTLKYCTYDVIKTKATGCSNIPHPKKNRLPIQKLRFREFPKNPIFHWKFGPLPTKKYFGNVILKKRLENPISIVLSNSIPIPEVFSVVWKFPGNTLEIFRE